MAWKDAGGSALGSSRGIGAGRSAANAGGFTASGGRGPVTKSGGSVSLPAYRQTSSVVRDWARSRGVNPVKATRALSETVREGSAIGVPKGTTTRGLTMLRQRLASNVRPGPETSAKGMQGSFGAHFLGRSPLYDKLPNGSVR